MKYPDYALLILKSLDGSITTDERATLNKWLDNDLQNQKAHDEISMIWNGAWEDDYSAVDEEHFLDQRERLMRRINEMKKEGESNQSFFRLFYQNMAAVAVIVITVTAFTSYLINKNSPHHIVSFKNANFKKITEVLQLNYNVHFQIPETSPSFSFTGTFIDEDVHTIIVSISEITGFKVELKNGIYIFKSPS